MPGFLLHVGAAVKCAHGGDALAVAGDARVRLSGQPLVTLTSIYTIVGCAMPPPIAGNGPCVTATWVVGATRVRASGAPALLLDSVAICAPTGTPLVPVQAQPRVRGM